MKPISPKANTFNVNGHDVYRQVFSLDRLLIIETHFVETAETNISIVYFAT